jgi:hypothetical protein
VITCLELNDIDSPIKLEQRANGTFRVTYGMQIKDYLSYVEAAHELGKYIFHALACASRLDNKYT